MSKAAHQTWELSPQHHCLSVPRAPTSGLTSSPLAWPYYCSRPSLPWQHTPPVDMLSCTINLIRSVPSSKCQVPVSLVVVVAVVVVQLLSHVWLFLTPWTAAHQAFLFFTISWSLLKLMSIESMMPSKHLILCCPLLLLPSIFPSIKVFSNNSALRIRWAKYLELQHQSSDGYSRLISFRFDWFDLLAVQGTLKSFPWYMPKFFIRLYITQPQLHISFHLWLPFFSPAALSCLQLQPHCAMCHLHSLPLVTLLPGTTPSPHHLSPLIALPKCYSVFGTQQRHHLLKRLCQMSLIPAQPPNWDRGLHLAPTALSCYTHSNSQLIMSLSLTPPQGSGLCFTHFHIPRCWGQISEKS